MSERVRVQARETARPARFPRFGAELPADTPAPDHSPPLREARGPLVPPAPPAATVERAREQARAEGLEAGRVDGRAQALAEWAPRLAGLAADLEAAARALVAKRIELAAEVDRVLPRLVFSLARKVLHGELSQPETPLRTAVRAVSERLAACDRPVALRLSPEAAAALGAARQSATDPEFTSLALRVDPDPTLGPGDWLLETEDGFLDGQVEAQLEAAWRLWEELG